MIPQNDTLLLFARNMSSLWKPRVHKKTARAVKKRQNGRYVEYLIVADKNASKGVWKQLKGMSEEDKEAVRDYRAAEKERKEDMKRTAKNYAEALASGRNASLNRYKMEEIELDLAVALNGTEIRTDEDIGDWGNTKHSVDIYEDTHLIKAVRRSDLKSVKALLGTGLCDPTLQTAPHNYVFDRYTPIESDIDTAMKAAKAAKRDVLQKIKTKPQEFRIYASSKDDSKSKAKRAARTAVKKFEDATRIEALVETALTMWPEATYKGPEKRSG